MAPHAVTVFRANGLGVSGEALCLFGMGRVLLFGLRFTGRLFHLLNRQVATVRERGVDRIGIERAPVVSVGSNDHAFIGNIRLASVLSPAR